MHRIRRITRLTLALLVLSSATGACAARSTSTTHEASMPAADSATAPGKLVPPKLISSAAMPLTIRTVETRNASMPSAPRPRIDFSYEVKVDTAGRAIVGTLIVRGAHADQLREQIIQWLRNAQFAPATLDGVPVEGWYKMRSR